MPLNHPGVGSSPTGRTNNFIHKGNTMTTHYLKRGNTFEISNQAKLNLHPSLPPANYVVKQFVDGKYYLDQIEDFNINHKLYGNIESQAHRILQTFNDRPATTGVMLTGEKGSGKTLLAKKISLLAAEQNMPTLIINTAFHGDDFNSFLQTITQPTVILFDEFEKVYDRHEQEAVLTLFDGVFPSKKLFVITCNDKYRINDNMNNRPGRMYYMLDFTGLNTEFIREYCKDNLKNQTHIDSVCRLSVLFEHFNFDMLKALVEEMNRYGETPQQAVAMLNIKPELSSKSNFTVKLKPSQENVDIKTLPDNWEGNPLSDDIHFGFYTEGKDGGYYESDFTVSDLSRIDHSQNQFEFTNSDGDHLTLMRKSHPIFRPMGAF